MNRRSFLGVVAGYVGLTSKSTVNAASAAQVPGATGRQLIGRVAHVTDTHVFHDRDCPTRMRAFLTHLRNIEPAPSLILHTGDVIYDALDADRDQVARQWTLWSELARELSSPPVYAIGNHDVWGKAPESDPLYGKKWAIDQLSLPNRFYSVMRLGWKFIILDSVHPIPRAASQLPGASNGWYTAALDAEQLSWLEGELSTTGADTHVAIVSHIPILSAGIFEWANSAEDVSTISHRLMHRDSPSIQNILRRHSNVKMCLSGHLHLLDHVVYDGISYLGCGAVSADWWRQAVFRTTPGGFATIDLFADGTSQRTYHPYNW